MGLEAPKPSPSEADCLRFGAATPLAIGELGLTTIDASPWIRTDC